MQNPAIAIVGATGLVGGVLLDLLQEKNFPLSSLHLVASTQSAGKKVSFRDQEITIQDLASFDFSQTRLAFFCVGSALAEEYIPIATAAGNVVIDKSNCFRYESDVPLIVPEVNPAEIKQHKVRGIIANPNCNTIPLAVALKPIYDAVGIARMNVATYQSVSGTGKDALFELTQQTKQVLDNEKVTPSVYPQQIAFNVLPHIDDFLDNDYTREEMKIVWEFRKIMGDNDIMINPTTVRVPVVCGHSAAVHIETKEKITVQQVNALLSAAPGVSLITGEKYPTPACHASGHDEVFVGRVREDISHPLGLNLWVVADNLRKGAALNAIQIASLLMKEEVSV